MKSKGIQPNKTNPTKTQWRGAYDNYNGDGSAQCSGHTAQDHYGAMGYPMWPR